MKFSEIQNLLEKRKSISKLADIAREFDVTPQVVSNWKARDHVPYRYVKQLRKKIKDDDNGKSFENPKVIIGYENRPINKDDEISYTELFNISKNIFGKNYKIFLLSSLIVMLLAIFYLFLLAEPIYTSNSKLILISKDGGASRNGLMGLAKNFGFSSMATDNQFSSKEVIKEILKSRKLALNLKNKKVLTEKYGSKKSLGFIFDDSFRSDTTKEMNTHLISNQIIQSISVTSKKNSMQTLNLSVTGFDPNFAKSLSDLVIIELKNIIYKFQSEHSKNKIAFIEKRLMSVKGKLIESENMLKEFRERNRNINSSPSLLLEQERLVREVQVQTQVFITLKNEYEVARIDDQNKEPIFQVLDRPNTPISKTSPKSFMLLFSSLITSLIIPFGYFFGRELIARNDSRNII